MAPGWQDSSWIGQRQFYFCLGSIILTSMLSGCVRWLDMPHHTPSKLTPVTELNIGVGIDVYDTFGKDKSAFLQEQANEARAVVIEAVRDIFTTKDIPFTVDEVRPSVQWKPSVYGGVEPAEFQVPDCGRKELGPDAASYLEVTAIETVRDTGQRACGAAACLSPQAICLLPIMPQRAMGRTLGSGTSAVQFCLFQPQSQRPVWAYAEWFHGGLDFRNSNRVKVLVERAYQHYKGTLRGNATRTR